MVMTKCIKMYSTGPDYTPVYVCHRFECFLSMTTIDIYHVGTAFDLFTSYCVIGGDCVRKVMVVMNVMLKMRKMDG